MSRLKALSLAAMLIAAPALAQQRPAPDGTTGPDIVVTRFNSAS